jgi:hypothetical protein
VLDRAQHARRTFYPLLRGRHYCVQHATDRGADPHQQHHGAQPTRNAAAPQGLDDALQHQRDQQRQHYRNQQFPSDAHRRHRDA